MTEPAARASPETRERVTATGAPLTGTPEPRESEQRSEDRRAQELARWHEVADDSHEGLEEPRVASDRMRGAIGQTPPADQELQAQRHPCLVAEGVAPRPRVGTERA